MPTLLRRISKSIQDPMSDLVSPGARKWLAGRPADKQFYISVLDELPDPGNELGLAEVPVEGQAPKVVPMSFCSLPVTVDAQDDPIACCLQAKAKSSSPTEQVRSEAATVLTQTRCIA
jgi:hypothetical protein